jgi:hypothetical protein
MRLGAGSRRSFPYFRPSGAERLRPESPFTHGRRCILPQSVARLKRVRANTRYLLRASRVLVGSGSESRMRRMRELVASPAVSPGSSSPGHLMVTHRARITSEQRDTCGRWVVDLHVRRDIHPFGCTRPR